MRNQNVYEGRLDKEGTAIYRLNTLLEWIKRQEKGELKLLVTEVYKGKEHIEQENLGLFTLAAFNEEVAQEAHYHTEGREIYIVLKGLLHVAWADKKNTRGATLFPGDTMVIEAGYCHKVRAQPDKDGNCVILTIKVPPDTDRRHGIVKNELTRRRLCCVEFPKEKFKTAPKKCDHASLDEKLQELTAQLILVGKRDKMEVKASE